MTSNRNNVEKFIAQIPRSYLLFWGKILGNILFYLAVPQRRIVRRNLYFSRFQSSPKDVKRLSRRIFQHFGITLIELLQMICFSKQDLISTVHIKGSKIIAEALSRQRGIILISAHLGNYEMAWHVVPCYLEMQMTGVAKKLRNARLNRLIHGLRTRFGNKIIYKKGALPEMMHTLRQGAIVAILMDISRRFEGVEVNFFGRRATATPAAALLGLRCKSPIIPAFCHRTERGTLIVELEPPVEMQRTGNLRVDLQTNTQRITDRVERAILRYPEQWNWLLKRWKDFYPDLYPESEKRLRHIKKKEKGKVKSH
ncbi:MAG: lysophospholipid acyltransferase family protein [Desulfobacterales bacterium]